MSETKTPVVKKVLQVAFLSLLAGYFIDTTVTPNPGARSMPVVALMDHGTWQIDEFQQHTKDKAFVDGHYYSDKAPLTSVLLLPLYAAMEKVSPARNIQEKFDRAIGVGTFALAAVPAALLASELIAVSGGFLWAFALVFSTFVWVYSGAFFGHVLAGWFLLRAYIDFFEKERPTRAGIWIGLAFLTEYPVGLALLAFGLGSLLSSRDWKPTARMALGFAPFGGVLLAYNAVITGNPFSMVYSHQAEQVFAEMNEALGFRLPSLTAMYGLLFGLARGLFVYAPAFIPLTCIVLARKAHRSAFLRSPVFFFFAGSLALFSSYYMWDGGWAYGPRHLIPAAMLLAYWLTRRLSAETTPKLLLPFALVGFLMALAANMTEKYMMPSPLASPMTELVAPLFFGGFWNTDSLTVRFLRTSPLVGLAVFVALMASAYWYFSRRPPLQTETVEQAG